MLRRGSDQQGKCPRTRMLTGSTETSPWWNTQVSPPLRSLSTPQSDGVWLGAGRFLPRHSGDLEVKPIPQCCHWANAISGEHKDMEDVTEDTQLPAPDVCGCPQVCLTLHLGLAVLPGVEVEQLLSGALPFLLLENSQAGCFCPREHRPAAPAGDLHPALLIRDSLLLLGLSLLLYGRSC